jgi:hypothetical protein
MGGVADQKNVFKAKANIQETWDDLYKMTKVLDMDAPLTGSIKGGLHDPSCPMVKTLLYIYQIECFVYRELNHASRFKDTSKIKTLGPYGCALFAIIYGA